MYMCVCVHNVCVDVCMRVCSPCVCVFTWGRCSLRAVCTQVRPCVSGDTEEGQADPQEFGGVFLSPRRLAPQLSQVRDSCEVSCGTAATIRLLY